MPIKLYVGNLPQKISAEDLRALFSKYGNVLQADHLPDRSIGFVHLGAKEEAQAAIMHLDGTEFHGRRINVELSTSTAGERGGPSSRGGRPYGPPRGGYGRGDPEGGRGGYHDRFGGPSRGGYPPRGRGRDMPERPGGYEGRRLSGEGPGRPRSFDDGLPPPRPRPPPPPPPGYDEPLPPPPPDLRHRRLPPPRDDLDGPPPPRRHEEEAPRSSSGRIDPLQEREMLILRDPVYRERLLREYERLLRIDAFERERYARAARESALMDLRDGYSPPPPLRSRSPISRAPVAPVPFDVARRPLSPGARRPPPRPRASYDYDPPPPRR